MADAPTPDPQADDLDPAVLLADAWAELRAARADGVDPVALDQVEAELRAIKTEMADPVAPLMTDQVLDALTEALATDRAAIETPNGDGPTDQLKLMDTPRLADPRLTDPIERARIVEALLQAEGISPEDVPTDVAGQLLDWIEGTEAEAADLETEEEEEAAPIENEDPTDFSPTEAEPDDLDGDDDVIRE